MRRTALIKIEWSILKHGQKRKPWFQWCFEHQLYHLAYRLPNSLPMTHKEFLEELNKIKENE